MFKYLLVVVFSLSLAAEDFKLPEKGQKFTIEYTLENDGEFKDVTGEVEFVQATIDYALLKDKSGKAHKVPRSYIKPKYRKIFFEEDHKKYADAIKAAEKRKELADIAKKAIEKFSSDQKIIYEILTANLPEYAKHVQENIDDYKKRAQDSKNRDIKNQTNSKATMTYHNLHKNWVQVQRNLKAGIIPTKDFLNFCFHHYESFYIRQVASPREALINFSKNGDLYYAQMDTRGFVDDRYFDGNGIYFAVIGTKTYSTAIGGSNTVKKLKAFTLKDITRPFNAMKAINGYR
ncbi:MAG: hypothetical protein NE327_17010 [Lentisphaeraceae bacterium]|nr:hypothetical protein [Lentisphaeraceae bacterium]